MENKKRILIIDDDPGILDSTQIILESSGFDTVTAASGEEGLEMFRKTKPDLVLCDMMMEKIDAGTKVAHEIRELDKDVPIYLMSSIGSATTRYVEVDELGFSGVFQKPVPPDALVKALRKVLKIS